MLQWFVVHTKPRQEATAALHLERQRFDVWLPRAQVSRRVRGVWVQRAEPLFPRYLFLRADTDTADISPVRSTRGCSGIVRVAGTPAPVPDGVVDWLMGSVDEQSGLVKIEREGSCAFNPGDKVRVVEGPFEGAEGLVKTVNGGERAVVLLSILSDSARVTVPLARLSAVGSS